ncbi:hypothetical protein ACWDNT_29165, partial [Streptomyces sp. NPDC000963]
ARWASSSTPTTRPSPRRCPGCPRGRCGGCRGVFGLRGIGSLFYLAYALGHHGFEGQAKELWVLTATTVALSVVLHGASATPVIRRLDRLREIRPSDAPP